MTTPQRKKAGINLLIPFVIVALVFGGLFWKKLQESREFKPVPKVTEPSALRKAVLFFVADGNRLVREARELESCSDRTECVKDLLDELFSGPVGEQLSPALPEAAALNSVRLEGDLAVVDLNRSFATDLPAGSAAEMLAVYSLVDTVCINFPQIARVQLTVEGDRNPQLKHLDLSEPLTPDYTLEQSSAPRSDGGSASSPSSIPSVKKGKP